MKAVVLHVEGAESVVLGDDGVVRKIKGRHDVGETIELGKLVSFPGRVVRSVAAAAAAVVLLVAGGAVGYRQFFQECSYASLDVNPSIEYVLNRQNRVLRVNALNEDAAPIVERLGRSGDLVDAIDRTTELLYEEHYLGEGTDNFLLVSVASENNVGDLAGAVEHYFEGRGDLTLSLSTASVEEARAARELGVSLGRYHVLSELAGGSENLTSETLAAYSELSVETLVAERDTAAAERGEPEPAQPVQTALPAETTPAETAPPTPTPTPTPTPSPEPSPAPHVHRPYQIERSEPTCTEDGMEAHYLCYECGALFDAELRPVVRSELLLPAMGHTPGEAVIEDRIEPACTGDGGYDKAVYCAVCGEELSREHVVLPALEHVPDEAVIENRIEPTCAGDGGYDKTVYCAVCGEELSREHIVLPALEHVPDEAVIENRIEPTCAGDGGYDKAVYCAVCGEELSREHVVLPALEHVPGEAVIENRIEPTCAGDGGYDKAVYCAVCGEELSREHVVLPALEHVPGEAVVENYVEPTCTEDGSYDAVVYCAVCGEELSRETVVIPCAGHDWGVPEWRWAEDLSAATAVFRCGRCGETQELSAEITVTVLSEPTEEQNGETEFRASVSFNGQTYEDVRTVETEWTEEPSPEPPPWWPPWWPWP